VARPIGRQRKESDQNVVKQIKSLRINKARHCDGFSVTALPPTKKPRMLAALAEQFNG